MRRTKRVSSLSKVTGPVGSILVTWAASTNRAISSSAAEPRRYRLFLYYSHWLETVLLFGHTDVTRFFGDIIGVRLWYLVLFFSFCNRH